MAAVSASSMRACVVFLDGKHGKVIESLMGTSMVAIAVELPLHGVDTPLNA